MASGALPGRFWCIPEAAGRASPLASTNQQGYRLEGLRPNVSYGPPKQIQCEHCLRCRILSIGEATNASQLNFRFAALAKARIESISRLICASKAAGVIGIGSMPCCASFSRTPGAANAFCDSWESLSTISRGVLAGTNTPVQNV